MYIYMSFESVTYEEKFPSLESAIKCAFQDINGGFRLPLRIKSGDRDLLNGDELYDLWKVARGEKED